MSEENLEYGPWQSKLAILLNRNINEIGNAMYYAKKSHAVAYLPLMIGLKSAFELKEQVKLMIKSFENEETKEDFAKDLFERLSNDPKRNTLQ